MAHRRSPIIKTIKISDVEIDDNFEHDPLASHLIKQELLGEIKVGLTRINADEITSGFYKRQSGVSVHVSNIDTQVVPMVMEYIRGGARPPVEVYWSPLVPNGGGYVCPDSEPNLAAYRALKIRMVPSRILRPIDRPGQEGAFWIECRGHHVGLAKIVPATVNGYVAFGGIRGRSPSEALKWLERKCAATAKKVISFHCDDSNSMHYHQVIHAVLRRHGRALDSVRRLINLGRLEHASFIVRASFESFLNFYIDWLAPHFIGPRLQLLSSVRITGSNEKSLDILCNFKNMFENTREKARASPLGLVFYDALYPGLSMMLHQSYIYVERESSGFADQSDEPDSVIRIVDCLNILTLALVERSLNDVGEKI